MNKRLNLESYKHKACCNNMRENLECLYCLEKTKISYNL